MLKVENPTLQKKQAGYTLTELLVVLVILGLIAAAITPQVIGRLDRSKVKAAELQMETLGASLDLFKIDLGRYPTSEEGLQALLRQPAGLDAWYGPYIRSAKNLTDPWGNPIQYKPPSDDAFYRLVSFGADGNQGGARDAADLTAPNLEFQR
ncbi:MAG: type II secretion system major pseudopilin GspG [Pseudomonadota bacterium]